MQERSRNAVAVWCLVFIVLAQQLDSGPVPELDGSSDSVQGAQQSLRRSARMTPLWRIMGSKPNGAYCQNHYECSTRVCSNGHCSFSQPINS